ncbi:unnamed protein product [Closterium sp. NIES-53]
MTAEELRAIPYFPTSSPLCSPRLPTPHPPLCSCAWQRRTHVSIHSLTPPPPFPLPPSPIPFPPCASTHGRVGGPQGEAGAGAGAGEAGLSLTLPPTLSHPSHSPPLPPPPRFSLSRRPSPPPLQLRMAEEDLRAILLRLSLCPLPPFCFRLLPLSPPPLQLRMAEEDLKAMLLRLSLCSLSPFSPHSPSPLFPHTPPLPSPPPAAAHGRGGPQGEAGARAGAGEAGGQDGRRAQPGGPSSQQANLVKVLTDRQCSSPPRAPRIPPGRKEAVLKQREVISVH